MSSHLTAAAPPSLSLLHLPVRPLPFLPAFAWFPTTHLAICFLPYPYSFSSLSIPASLSLTRPLCSRSSLSFLHFCTFLDPPSLCSVSLRLRLPLSSPVSYFLSPTCLLPIPNHLLPAPPPCSFQHWALVSLCPPLPLSHEAPLTLPFHLGPWCPAHLQAGEGAAVGGRALGEGVCPGGGSERVGVGRSGLGKLQVSGILSGPSI